MRTFYLHMTVFETCEHQDLWICDRKASHRQSHPTWLLLPCSAVTPLLLMTSSNSSESFLCTGKSSQPQPFCTTGMRVKGGEAL